MQSAYTPLWVNGHFYPQQNQSSSDKTSKPCQEPVEGNYLGLYRVLVGVWGKHTAHFMTVFGYGAVRYEYLWHHLTVCPYFPDDRVAQKYKTFCYMSKLRLFLRAR